MTNVEKDEAVAALRRSFADTDADLAILRALADAIEQSGEDAVWRGGERVWVMPAPAAEPVAWRKDLNPPHGNWTLIWQADNPWPGQFHVSALYAAPQPAQADEGRELLREVVRRYDDYRGKGVLPAPGEYQMVVGAIEHIRAYLARTGGKETL